ncbi:hypothetical protein Hdeb2414_s1070g00978011 [Helianthus debilis subsp. tardiflorus]
MMITSSSNGSNNSLNGWLVARETLLSQLVRASSSGSSSLGRRGDGLGRRRWSPFDTLLWISIELGLHFGTDYCICCCFVCIKNENPADFLCLLGLSVTLLGVFASLPFLYWRYLHRNQTTENGSNQARQPPSEANQHRTKILT